ncbi:hypothetical protein KSP40_PGU001752 [Platanthera guangdongensis]|uniref:Uncharacterized protein n=1 Tax=Platanthera guangdongensis TaxID=2320717 RepID=A0ABR2LD03_9ASPA
MTGNNHRSGSSRRSSESCRLTVTTLLGLALGFFLGISVESFYAFKLNLASSLSSTVSMALIESNKFSMSTLPSNSVSHPNAEKSSERHGSSNPLKIYVESNPRGTKLLAPGIIVSESDFYLRRLWGDPVEDLPTRPRYLVAFAVGFDQSKNVDAAVKKFSNDFTVMLFHYDGRVSEWEQFEWSQRAIHVSVRKQAKWWYAKRFLHPDVVAAYDYVFVWDEDLGLKNFDAEKYIHLVNKYGLEISQPAVEPSRGLTWQMTVRKSHSEVHKETSEKPGWCVNPHFPPCAAFVEMMAPVFSKAAWRCVWHMLQNDLVHGWGLDFAVRRCVEPAYMKIGVVDSQWIVHQAIPSLGNQGESSNWNAPWLGVRERCKLEWSWFQARLANAERNYFRGMQKG